MSPDIVVLDTRQAHDKAGFLAAAAHDLGFPDHFGHNWDAFEECARDFAHDRKPVLVVWTGAAGLPDDVRQTAIEILSEAFVDGADVLIVDDVTAGAQPDFAVSVQRVAVPLDGVEVAQDFWRGVGFTVSEQTCEADAITIHLVQTPDFHAGLGPQIACADVMGLAGRLAVHGIAFTETPRGIDVLDPHGTLISFIAY